VGTGEASMQVFGFSAVHLQWYQISSPGPWGNGEEAGKRQLDASALHSSSFSGRTIQQCTGR